MNGIIGNTVGTPTPQTNYNQTDPTKADYLIGREQILNSSDGYDIRANARALEKHLTAETLKETWTFKLADGSTITKNVCASSKAAITIKTSKMEGMEDLSTVTYKGITYGSYCQAGDVTLLADIGDIITCTVKPLTAIADGIVTINDEGVYSSGSDTTGSYDYVVTTDATIYVTFGTIMKRGYYGRVNIATGIERVERLQ